MVGLEHGLDEGEDFGFIGGGGAAIVAVDMVKPPLGWDLV
jgi:hypothetical protein